ncbi:MAG: hypothetical protein WDN07_01690 [Actinomycetota bacterium]
MAAKSESLVGKCRKGLAEIFQLLALLHPPMLFGSHNAVVLAPQHQECWYYEAALSRQAYF